ncbi:alpha/beta fold hydrolase [Pedobacter aquatilis]|uniref:alpha/beta fold hydrolase n=1 Tax=Pedobacter aquatilis TaxID=351343 RepID=UPI002930B072|nr:alpha/beta fold hydrolase [Pedobacter aquatilis]
MNTPFYHAIVLVFLVLVLNNANLFSQSKTLVGTTIDKTNAIAIPYASISLKNRNIGTVSDSIGKFRFSYLENEMTKSDSIFFSAIGYETLKLSFNDFLKNEKTIQLKQVIQVLETIKITAAPQKLKKYGRWTATLIFFPKMYKSIPEFSDEKGREQATILKIDKDILLQKLHFRINKRSFERIKLRMNIYNVENDLPGKSILDKDVIFDIIGSKAIGMPTTESIDLKPYQINIKGLRTIALSLSILDLKPIDGDTTQKTFYLPSLPNPLKSSLYRLKGAADWQKVSGSHLLLGIEAYSRKTGQEELSDVDNHNDTALLKTAPQLSELLYGNNKGQKIKVDDGEIYYETYGKGMPLILLHGNNESINSFRKQIGTLSAHYKIIAIDTRGQGNSTNNKTTPYSYELFAKDLQVVMDALSIKKANILGWSDGGNTALTFALKNQNRINKMIIMGANLSPGHDAIDNRTLDIFKKRRDSLKQNTDLSSLNQLRLTNLVLEQPQIKAIDLDTIKVPVLVLAGESDVVKESHTRLIHAHLKNSKITIIQNSNHYAPLNNAEVFNSLVLDFLKTKH